MAARSSGSTASGMHELDRITHALATKRLDAHLFERCATDFLIEVYPGLSPIPGGTDWGRDADVHGTANPVPPRLLVTSSRSIEGVKENMVSGLKSLAKHCVKVERVVLANPALINEQQRQKLRNKARELGVTIDAFHDRDFFASKLRRDGEWRKALLGLSGEPISLSRVPSHLAEHPWASIPLVGREAEIELLQANRGDAILVGAPGVGKTRLAAALANAVFVDVDIAESSQVANDLRWLQPELVVLDDAGQHSDLVRYLTKLRRSENDLLSYRIVCVCWPDEIAAIEDLLPGAQQIEIPLLERQYIDQIILSMGVRSQLARQEIIDQAEGRPGWAIAITDILTKTQQWDSLLSGRVLLGEVARYLRRARVGTEAIHLLTTIAALGGIIDNHIPALATSLNLPVPIARQLLLGAAHSGLLDSINSYAIGGRQTRHYSVRPPMLADALVAEHAFRSAVPAVDLLSLADAWPDALGQITRSAITSALMGADARFVAGELIRRYRDGSAATSPGLGALAQLYACIDPQTGREVLSWARAEFKSVCQTGDGDAKQLETIVELAELLARRYLFAEAVHLILDIGMLDARPTNQFPSHPLRAYESLITDYHPDLAPPPGLRQLVANTTDVWLAQNFNAPRAYEVYGAAISSLLSIHRSGRYLDAANRRQVNIVETVVSPLEIEDIYESIWPQIKERLISAPPLTVRCAIEEATNYLRIGGGHDRPFGINHPDDAIEAANRFGAKIFLDLAEVVADKPGLTVLLERSASRFGLNLSLQPMGSDLALFFVDIERGERWEEATTSALEAIKEATAAWGVEDPSTVIDRLIDLRTQLDICHLKWPNRVEWVCQALSESVPNPLTWVEAAIAGGLFPEAEPFVRAAVSRSAPIPQGLIEKALEDHRARWRFIDSILSVEEFRGEVQYVLDHLAPSDYPVVEAMAFRKGLSVERQRQLLTIPSVAARGAAAFALARPVHADDDNWPPAELESDWLTAIQLFDPAATPEVRDHQLRSLFVFLRDRYPGTLADYMKLRLRKLANREVWTPFDELIQGLHLLPSNDKTGLLREFRESRVAWLLLRYMPGNDLEWISESLDQGLITIEEVLGFRKGLRLTPEPSIADLARLLVPRGMEPERVAAVAEFGIGWGEGSERASKLMDQFEALSESEDDNISAVGRAGLKIFSKKRESALERERVKRIRGDL